MLGGSPAFAGQIEKSLSEFDQVEFTGNYEVKMVKADSNYIVIINQDDKVTDDEIIVDIDNKTLKMSIKNDIYIERDITVKLYYKDIDKISARRAAQVESDKLQADKIEVAATTGGKIVVAVKCNHLDVSIKSGGSVRVNGGAKTAHYDVNAGGTIAAINVDVPVVEACIQFGGEVILTATETLEVKIKAGGVVSYKGNPSIKSQSIKLGGKIENLDEKGK